MCVPAKQFLCVKSKSRACREMTQSKLSICQLILMTTILACLVNSSESLLEITDLVFGGHTSGIIAAFGDYNADKLTDVFVLSKSGKDLRIYLASEKQPFLLPSAISCSLEKGVITSVVPGDFDGDSKMDILLTISDDIARTKVNILWGSNSQLNCTFDNNSTIKLKGQPLILDFNGNKLADIFGVSELNNRMVWEISADHNITSFLLSNGTGSLLRTPHSHTFIDLNRDLAADLLLTTETGYEVWLNQNGVLTYMDNLTYAYPPAAIVGQTVALDIDLDGTINHLVPVCVNADCSNSTMLVWSDNKWLQVNIDFLHDNVRWGFVPPVAGLTSLGQDTITLRVGDYDLDGFPDLVAVLRSTVSGEQKAFILQNNLCATCEIRYAFKVLWDLPGLSSVNNVVLATFFDIYNDGILDILLVKKLGEGNWTMKAFQNDYDRSACFIKVIVLSGLCYTSCPKAIAPYGVNQPGPFICYKTMTLDGMPQTSCAGQLSQSAHFALQLPYVIFGLGHTPNFVDLLKVGVPNPPDNALRNHEWTSLIPNSQMFVIPHLDSDNNRWINKLFVTPSHLVLITFFALLGVMVFILFVILGLYLKERRDDKKEKQQEAHRFHFDAM